MTTKAQLYSLKMRASQQNAHISGAENIIPEDELQDYCVQLLQRALQHSKGKPDFINFKIEAVQPEEILTLPALPVHTISTDTPKAMRCVEQCCWTLIACNVWSLSRSGACGLPIWTRKICRELWPPNEAKIILTRRWCWPLRWRIILILWRSFAFPTIQIMLPVILPLRK